jgi:hypothetical protein
MNFYDVIFAQQKTKTDGKYFGEISDAINVLAGTETTYTPSEMAPAILDAIPTETASGNPINITDAAAYPAVSCVTTLEPVQDLHGYDKPWPAGGGKNLLPMTAESQTINGVTFTVNDDGVISVQGTATESIIFYMFNTTPLPNNNYILTVGEITVENGSGGIYASTENDGGGTRLASGVKSGAVNISNVIGCVWVYLQNGAIISGTIKPMVRLASVADATYEPYSNICPISGHTGVELKHSGADTSIYETHSQTFPQAQSPVYGCEVDWTNGVLRVDTALKIVDDISDFASIGRTPNANFLYGTFTGITKPYPNAVLPPTSKFKANILELSTGNDVWSGSTPNVFGTNSNGNLVCQFGNLTEQELQALLQETPLQVVYELPAPLEIPPHFRGYHFAERRKQHVD